jgi:tripartite-type tricarboxylate transporter receptor subunit TctC
MPDVPTMAELGYPGFEIEGWLGVFVPAATPKEIVKKLSDELARIVASPEGIAGIETLSLVPVGGSTEDFDKALRRDLEKWADVAKQTGVKGE